MKHNKFFKDFLEEKVNLNQTRIDLLEGRKETIINFLSDNLKGYRGYSDQGSYTHKMVYRLKKP